MVWLGRIVLHNFTILLRLNLYLFAVRRNYPKTMSTLDILDENCGLFCFNRLLPCKELLRSQSESSQENPKPRPTQEPKITPYSTKIQPRPTQQTLNHALLNNDETTPYSTKIKSRPTQ